MTKKHEETPFKGIIVSPVIKDPTSFYPEHIKDVLQFSPSGSAIQGTIDYLSESMSTFEKRMEKYSFVSPNPADKDEILLVKNDLGAFKGEMIQKLEESRNHAIEMDKIIYDFINKNASFLKTAVEAEGKFQAVEGRLSALENRLSTLESNKNIGWNKNATLISIIIAFLGTFCFTCVGCIGISLYAALK